ncbi:MAG: AraC family transcriptional regulator [Opitutales bacterium]
MQCDRQLQFRANRQPTADLPLHVRSCGDYRVAPPFFEETAPKPFWQVFWIASGSIRFEADDRAVVASPGSVFVYRPGEAHWLRILDSDTRYRWLTLDTPGLAEAATFLGLEARLRSAGACPHPLFDRLDRAVSDPLPAAEAEASRLAYAILLEMRSAGSGDPGNDDPLMRRIRDSLDREFNRPDLNIDSLARRHGLHRTTLLRRFRRQFGLPPSRYLDNLRLQEALSLLKRTALPIGTVAERCGFADPNYLTKKVRSATGQAPGVFRARG